MSLILDGVAVEYCVDGPVVESFDYACFLGAKVLYGVGLATPFKEEDDDNFCCFVMRSDNGVARSEF